jgi:hypothetical protein
MNEYFLNTVFLRSIWIYCIAICNLKLKLGKRVAFLKAICIFLIVICNLKADIVSMHKHTIRIGQTQEKHIHFLFLI